MSGAPGVIPQTLQKTALEHQTSRCWHSSPLGWEGVAASSLQWAVAVEKGVLLVWNASGVNGLPGWLFFFFLFSFSGCPVAYRVPRPGIGSELQL